MFNLGMFEITLFGVIALIVLGPDKLPEAARTLGRWYAFFKNTKERLQNEVANELRLLETQEELKKELAKLKATESELKAQMGQLQASVASSLNQVKQELADPKPAQIDDKTTSETDNKDGLSTPTAQSPNIQATEPMTGEFFLLSDYDRQKRLPKAPLLPNYRPDRLLYDIFNNLGGGL